MTRENKKPELKAMKAVYTYFFPEVREIVHTFDNLPSSLFLTSTSVEEAQEVIDRYDWKTPFIVPATPQGKVDLDMIHIPVVEKILESYKTTIPALKDFQYAYFTAGSSEGIFHVLSNIASSGNKTITTIKGEYEGYKEYGKTLRLRIEEVSLDELSSLEKRLIFISNPSAVDGNILENSLINNISNNGNKIHLDLAYVGSTKEHLYDISNENIETVFLSLSKPYGVFRFRTGFTFSRKPLDSLYGNKWFKDITRTLTAAKIVEQIGPESLHELYHEKQKLIVNEINKTFDLGLQTSDAILLSNVPKINKLDEEKKLILKQYLRGQDQYRLCLTPYYEELEKQNGVSK